jgi:hypothetical protein
LLLLPQALVRLVQQVLIFLLLLLLLLALVRVQTTVVMGVMWAAQVVP